MSEVIERITVEGDGLTVSLLVWRRFRRSVPGMVGLVLVGFREADLAPLKWEPSRGGALFPHVYGPITTALACSVDPLPLVNGAHRFPGDGA